MMDTEFTEEEVVENPTLKAAYNLAPLHQNRPLKWDYEVDLVGKKAGDKVIHLCETCNLPILTYGRLVPCKHIFCLHCAKSCGSSCDRCDATIQKVDTLAHGTVYVCPFGAPKNSTKSCRKTYLSERDLRAHYVHRHLDKAATEPKAPQNVALPLPLTQQQAATVQKISQPPPTPHSQPLLPAASSHQPMMVAASSYLPSPAGMASSHNSAQHLTSNIPSMADMRMRAASPIVSQPAPDVKLQHSNQRSVAYSNPPPQTSEPHGYRHPDGSSLTAQLPPQSHHMNYQPQHQQSVQHQPNHQMQQHLLTMPPNHPPQQQQPPPVIRHSSSPGMPPMSNPVSRYNPLPPPMNLSSQQPRLPVATVGLYQTTATSSEPMMSSHPPPQHHQQQNPNLRHGPGLQMPPAHHQPDMFSPKRSESMGNMDVDDRFKRRDSDDFRGRSDNSYGSMQRDEDHFGSRSDNSVYSNQQEAGGYIHRPDTDSFNNRQNRNPLMPHQNRDLDMLARMGEPGMPPHSRDLGLPPPNRDLGLPPLNRDLNLPPPNRDLGLPHENRDRDRMHNRDDFDMHRRSSFNSGQDVDRMYPRQNTDMYNSPDLNRNSNIGAMQNVDNFSNLPNRDNRESPMQGGPRVSVAAAGNPPGGGGMSRSNNINLITVPIQDEGSFRPMPNISQAQLPPPSHALSSNRLPPFSQNMPIMSGNPPPNYPPTSQSNPRLPFGMHGNPPSRPPPPMMGQPPGVHLPNTGSQGIGMTHPPMGGSGPNMPPNLHDVVQSINRGGNPGGGMRGPPPPLRVPGPLPGAGNGILPTPGGMSGPPPNPRFSSSFSGGSNRFMQSRPMRPNSDGHYKKNYY